MSLNYAWIAHIAPQISNADADVLDFGCGEGQALKAVSQANPRMRVRGTDTYEGHYVDWRKSMDPDIASRIERIDDGRLPFPDNSFDLVFANQVFEHVFEPDQPLREIARVLKPGGQFLALFPCRGTWYEGHLGIYFAHWLQRWPPVLRVWLRACHRLGFGMYRENVTSREWVESRISVLRHVCVYHSWSEFRSILINNFGSRPIPLEHDNIAFRLKHTKLAPLASLASRWPLILLANLIHRLRGGRVFSIVLDQNKLQTTQHNPE